MSRDSKPAVLLASSDSATRARMGQLLGSLGYVVEMAVDGAALTGFLASGSAPDAPKILLLDAQLDGVAGGELLARIEDSGAHRRSSVAVIAGDGYPLCTEQWLSRLREGILDDIVSRDASAAEWSAHLCTMQRGHRLRCELEVLREKAFAEMRYDRLTGVLNREAMLSILFRETDRVQRLNGELCLILLDIDGFGAWNTELGIECCDQILRQVAARVGRLLRSYDVLGRMSKDEFLLILPGCSTVSAVMLAERLQQDVFGAPFVIRDERFGGELKVQITACFGIISSGGRSPVVVLREAELTLERARQMGPESIRLGWETYPESLPGALLLFPEQELAGWRD